MVRLRWVPPSFRAAPDAPIVALGALAAAILIYLGRSLTFWQDEWGSIAFDGSPADFLRPVNEHWSTIPLLLYRATFQFVGLHSHLPYMAQVVALHLVAVGGAYVLIRARTGRSVATLACIPLLVLGSGSENLFWAFQTGFIGSVAFGLWALVLLERRGRRTAWGSVVLLVLSLMSSGMGLFFLVAAAGRTLLDPAIRSRALAVIPPAVVYVAWYVTVGHDPVTSPGHLAGLVALPGFVARGIGHAVGAFSGLEFLPRGETVAIASFAIAVLATAWAVIRTRRPPALAGGTLIAIGTMYAVIGLVRAQLASDFATRSRYVYVAAFLMVLALADWLPRIRDWANARGARVPITAVGVVLLAVVTVVNLADLGTIRDRFQANADLTRAYVELALQHDGEAWVDPESVLPGMPRLPGLIAILERSGSGSPLRDDLVPSVNRDPGPQARETALLRMVGSGFRTAPGDGARPPLPLEVTTSTGVTFADGACGSVADAARGASLSVRVPTGSRIRIIATDAVAGHAALGLARPPSRSIDVALPAAMPVDVVVPDLGDGAVWTVALQFPSQTGTISICRVDGR